MDRCTHCQRPLASHRAPSTYAQTTPGDRALGDVDRRQEASETGAVPWTTLVAIVAFALCAVWASAGMLARFAPAVAEKTLPLALLTGGVLGLGLLFFARSDRPAEFAEPTDERVEPPPDARELVHFVESRVQEILADFADEENGAPRVAMAREAVSFEPDKPLVHWGGRPVLCGGPVEQTQVCPSTGTLAVLLTEETCEARLEVYSRDGTKCATLAPPDGFRFIELRLGYVPPFSVKRIAAVVRCRTDTPIDGASDWQFRIDADTQQLDRLSPIVSS